MKSRAAADMVPCRLATAEDEDAEKMTNIRRNTRASVSQRRPRSGSGCSLYRDLICYRLHLQCSLLCINRMFCARHKHSTPHKQERTIGLFIMFMICM